MMRSQKDGKCLLACPMQFIVAGADRSGNSACGPGFEAADGNGRLKPAPRKTNAHCYNNGMPAIEHLVECALYVDDLDKAEAFYGGILGLSEIARIDGRHVFYQTGAGVLLLFVA